MCSEIAFEDTAKAGHTRHALRFPRMHALGQDKTWIRPTHWTICAKCPGPIWLIGLRHLPKPYGWDKHKTVTQCSKFHFRRDAQCSRGSKNLVCGMGICRILLHLIQVPPNSKDLDGLEQAAPVSPRLRGQAARLIRHGKCVSGAAKRA